MSCQPHRITSGQSNSAHISKCTFRNSSHTIRGAFNNKIFVFILISCTCWEKHILRRQVRFKKKMGLLQFSFCCYMYNMLYYWITWWLCWSEYKPGYSLCQIFGIIYDFVHNCTNIYMYLMKNASVNTCIKCITFQENTSGILMKNICHNSLCRMHT